MNALAAVVASYGLLENSTAVVIGAMIILMPNTFSRNLLVHNPGEHRWELGINTVEPMAIGREVVRGIAP